MITISLANLKGGCSKTNTTYALSAAYAQRSARVLVCDTDPQGSIGSSFWSAAHTEAIPKCNTTATLFDLDAPPARVDALVHPSGIEGLSVIPANIALAEYNTNPQAEGDTIQLAQFLAEVESDYDICLIDTPPSMQRCTVAALMASDWVICPVIPEQPAVEGLSHILRTVEHVRAGGNARLRVLGLLITMWSRISVHSAFTKVLRERYERLVFDQVIPTASAYKEAIIKRIPVTIGAPKSAAASAIRSLVAEMDARMNNPGVSPDGQG